MGLFNRSAKSATTTATPVAPVFDAPTAAIDDIAGDYTLDVTHTRIGFSARHAMVTTVRGQFGEFEGGAHLDTTDPKWTSRKCVQARKAVYEYDDHGNLRTVVGVAGNVVVPLAGTAGSLALSKRQDKERTALNARVQTSCISKKRRPRN